MKIPVLGDLRPADAMGWSTSAALPIPYLGGSPLTFTLIDLVEEDEAEVVEAVSAFLGLGPEDRSKAVPYLHAYYRMMVDEVGMEDWGGGPIDSEADVWSLVEPTNVYVSRRGRRDRSIYVTISAECGWEPEHGLQLVYRRGADLVRVSEQDGHLTNADAFGLPESEDRIWMR